MRHRCHLILLLLLFAAAPLPAQERVDRRLAADPDVAVRIFNLIGFTRVIGWDRDTIAVTGTLPVGAGHFVAGGTRGAVKLGIDTPGDSAGSAAATLEIHVPHGARVWVKGAASDIEISGVDGELDLYSVSGRIRVEGQPRQLSAESIDGNIEVEGRAASTRVRTAGGAITLRYLRGALTASSVSGPIRIGGAALTRGRLESVSGEVSYKGDVLGGGTLDVQTHSGLVELRLPPAVSADFDLVAYAGAITSEFGSADSARAGRRRFSTGTGSALITVRTFKGAVRLVRQ